MRSERVLRQFVEDGAVLTVALEATIERLVLDADLRVEPGRRARACVEGRGRPRRVAGRYLRLGEGTVFARGEGVAPVPAPAGRA